MLRNKPVALLGMALLIGFIVWGLLKNQINDVFYDYFSEYYETSRANDFIFDHLTGIATLEYEIEADNSGTITEPAYLAKLEALSRWFEVQSEVYQVNTLTNVMKCLSRNMHNDSDDYYRLPEDRNLAAQYLLVYEMSLPYGLTLNNQVNMTKSATRLVVTLHKMGSKELLDLAARAEKAIIDLSMERMVSKPISPDFMFATIGQRNNRSLLIVRSRKTTR